MTVTAEERARAREAAERLHDADLTAAIDIAQDVHRDESNKARTTKDRSKMLAHQARARDAWAHLSMLKAVRTERQRHYAGLYKQRAAAYAATVVEPLALLDIIADLGPTTRANVRSAFARLVEDHLKANPEPYDGFGLGYVRGLIEEAIDRRVTNAIAAALDDEEVDLKRVRGRDMRKALGVSLGRVNANEWCIYTEAQLADVLHAKERREARRQANADTWDGLALLRARCPDISADLDHGTATMSLATLVALANPPT